MNKEIGDQEEYWTSQSALKSTSLETRLEEARALRREVLAQREQEKEGSSDLVADPENRSEPPRNSAADTQSHTNESVFPSKTKQRQLPTTGIRASADDKSSPANLPVMRARRGGRFAERLVLGLGIGLGIGASLYLGASLTGGKLALVSTEATDISANPQLATLSTNSQETNEIVSPTYVSLVEPVSSGVVSTSISGQKLDDLSLLPLPPAAAISTNDVALLEAETNVPVMPQYPDSATSAAVTEAAVASVEANATRSLVPITPVQTPNEASPSDLLLARVPDQDIVTETDTNGAVDPAPTVGGESDAPVAVDADTTAPLASPNDLRLPGAEGFTVILNAPITLSDEDVATAANGIRETGMSLDQVDRINFRISATQVRFFRPVDAAPAAAVANRIGAQARDFTSYRPSPPAGTIEIFLAGGGDSTARRNTRRVLDDTGPAKRATRRYPNSDDR